MNLIGDIQYKAISWCHSNDIYVAIIPDGESIERFKVVVDMGDLGDKVSDESYHVDEIDAKVWSVYMELYFEGVSN